MQALELSSVSAVGVKTPVQVMLSPDVMAAKEPEGQLTSEALANAATASENTIVRVGVSPAFIATSLNDMLLTDGASVSTL